MLLESACLYPYHYNILEENRMHHRDPHHNTTKMAELGWSSLYFTSPLLIALPALERDARRSDSFGRKRSSRATRACCSPTALASSDKSGSGTVQIRQQTRKVLSIHKHQAHRPQFKAAHLNTKKPEYSKLSCRTRKRQSRRTGVPTNTTHVPFHWGILVCFLPMIMVAYQWLMLGHLSCSATQHPWPAAVNEDDESAKTATHMH